MALLSRTVLIRLFLTLLLCLFVMWLMLNAADHNGVLQEVSLLGVKGALLVITIFFALVACYCRDLQRLLQLLQPANRTTQPKHVWLMFLIPYNFIEDFYIVNHIVESLKNEATDCIELKRYAPFGFYSGMGWCIAQIMAFVPNWFGQVASVVAIILWIVHWCFIRKIIRFFWIERG